MKINKEIIEKKETENIIDEKFRPKDKDVLYVPENIPEDGITGESQLNENYNIK